MSRVDYFSQACNDFGLTISLKKTCTMGHDTDAPPVITIDDYELDVVCQFTYLGTATADKVSMDSEIDMRTGKAASTYHGSSVDKPEVSVNTRDGTLQCMCY